MSLSLKYSIYLNKISTMSLKDELTQVVNDIQESIVKIGMAKGSNPIICNNLILVSMDLQKASSLVKQAKDSNKLPSIRNEAKMFLHMTDTISHWAKHKDWKNICADVGDIGDEILVMTMEIQDSLKPKHKKKKTTTLKVTPLTEQEKSNQEEKIFWDEINEQKSALKLKIAESKKINAVNAFDLKDTYTKTDDALLKTLFRKMRN